MKLKTVKDLDVRNKRVLLRVDYNVPIKDGVVGDTLRIRSSFETINYLLEQGCSLVLISHMGRPHGKPDPELSLAPVAKAATKLLRKTINFVDECVGPKALSAAQALKAGELVLLQNLRFHIEEEENGESFAAQLAELGEVFVDDAFADIHRVHASIVGVTKHLPSAAGLLVAKEVTTITQALETPDRPLVAVVGGAKVSTKIGVLSNLMNHVDKLVVGGAMANTFFGSRGIQIGKSASEPDHYQTATELTKLASDKGVELVLPQDVVVADSLEHGPGRVVPATDVQPEEFIVDMGPQTVSGIINPLDFHGTVIWNGPLGITEVPEFAHHSVLLAHNIIDSGAHSIIGGGDTAAFIDEAGLHDRFSWVSTGGGACLELMAGNKLAGLEALKADA